MTKEDIKEAVHEAIKMHSSCHTFSPEEIVMIKRRLRAIDKIASVIGYAVIAAVLAGIAALATLGEWFRWK